MKELTLGEIAGLVGGKLIGDPSVRIKGVAGLQEAGEGDITFVVSERYVRGLQETRASAAIVPRELQAKIPVIVVPNPYLAIVKLLKELYPPKVPPRGVSDLAWISPTAKLGREVSVGPFVYVGDRAEIGDGVILYPGVYVGAGVKVGEGSILHPHVVLYEGTVVGKGVVIHAGTVIGADGFGYLREGERIVKIPQVGGVEIGDGVEIGANCAIDRATFGWTRIGRGTKIDNLVQVGHNVRIGPNCIIVAQVGIGGSTEVGQGVTLAGQVGISDHVKIGDGAKISAKAGIFRDVKPGEAAGGIPQMPHRRWIRVVAEIMRLPELRRELEDLRRRVQELEKSPRGEGD